MSVEDLKNYYAQSNIDVEDPRMSRGLTKAAADERLEVLVVLPNLAVFKIFCL